MGGGVKTSAPFFVSIDFHLYMAALGTAWFILWAAYTAYNFFDRW